MFERLARLGFRARDGRSARSEAIRSPTDLAAPKKPSRPSFDIQERTGYYEGAAWISQVGRLAHISVFAYHPIRDNSADHRDPTQWQFYVVPARQPPASKRIGLVKVASLTSAVDWSELAAAVERARETTYIESNSGKP
jgi:hypothetical protein